MQKHLQSSTVTEYWNAIQGRISSPDSTLATPCERGLLMWPTVKSPEQYPCSSPHYFSLTLKRNSFTFFKQWSGRFNEFGEQVGFSIDRYLNFPHMNSKILNYMLIQGHTVLWYWILVKSLYPIWLTSDCCLQQYWKTIRDLKTWNKPKWATSYDKQVDRKWQLTC